MDCDIKNRQQNRLLPKTYVKTSDQHQMAQENIKPEAV